MNRRTALKLAGTATATLLAAGCLAEGVDDGGSGGDGSDERDDGDGSDDGGETDLAKPDDVLYVIDVEGAPLEASGDYATLVVDLVDPSVAPDDPARITAELTNDTEGTLTVSSGAPSPFGVVWARPANAEDQPDSGEVVTLWSDAYEDSSHVHSEGRDVRGVDGIGLQTSLEEGETISRTFELHEETPGLEAGSYEAEIGCSLGEIDGDGSTRVSVDLAFDLEHVDDEDESDGSAVVEAEYEVADAAPSLDPAVDPRGETVLLLESEAETAAAFEYDDGDEPTFVADTDFETEALVYAQGVAPQICYRADLRSLSWEGDTLGGLVAIERTADEGEACGEAVTYPAVLARVETGDREVEGENVEIVEE